MKPQILERSVAYRGYLTVEKLRIKLAGGVIVARDIETHGDAAAVLPYDIERQCALVVRLFRAPVFSVTQQDTIEEACAGMIEHEEGEAAARREAYEELGVSLHDLESVGRVWSSPGVSTERQSLFLAPYVAADRVGKGGGVAGENEGITVVERPLELLARELDQGRIVDGKLFALILALRLRKPELFTSASVRTKSTLAPGSARSSSLQSLSITW
jgi:nudix-type nucleoside diphosphatase (YffH/AdpP family)